MYDQLYRFNLHAQEMIETLKTARGKPGIPKEMSAYYQALVQEVRSLASQDILESMNEVEIKNALLSSRQRKQYEKRLYDESWELGMNQYRYRASVCKDRTLNYNRPEIR